MNRNIGTLCDQSDQGEKYDQQNKRARLAHALARVSTWEWQVATNCVSWGEDLNEWMGIDSKVHEVEYTELMKAVWRKDRDVLNHAIFQCLEKGARLDIQIRFRTPNKRVIWLHVQGDVVKDGRGVPQVMLGVVQDVTAQHVALMRYEQTLDELSYLRDAVEAHALLVVANQEGLISYLSNSVLSDTGFDRDALMGKPLSNLLGDGTHHRLERTERVLRDGQIWVGELTCKRAYQEPFDVGVTAVPHLNENADVDRLALIFSDISEQREMESALKESESRYYALFENSPEGIVWLSLDGLVLDANEPFRTMMGCADNELPEMRFADISEGLAMELESGYLRRHLFEMGNTHTLERDIIGLDGRVFPVSLRFILQRDVKGGASAIWCVCRDITERKQAEQALKASEASYRSLVENAPEAILVIDLDSGRFVEANQKAPLLFGLGKTELLATHLMAFSPKLQPTGEDSGEMLLRYLSQAEAGYTPNFEWSMQNVHGQQRVVSIGLASMSEERRSLIRVSMFDITERKQMEQRAKESQNRFRTVFNQSATGIMLLGPHGEVIDANPAVLRMLNYKRRDFVGQSMALVLPKTEHDEFLKLLDHLGYGGGGYAFQDEMYLMAKPDKQVSVRFSLTQMKDGDVSQRFFVLMCEDVTEQKRLVKQLEQAKKMETLGQLTGGIAHDFNNILASVMGYASLAKQRFYEIEDPKLEEYLNQIVSAGERAKHLIQQMLTFSRGGKGKLANVAINTLIEETLEMVRSVIPSSIVIVKDIEQVPLVRVDPTQIHQVILNLCVNARDACQEHGTIRVSCRLEQFSGLECNSCHATVRGEFVALRVQDTGIGMSAKVLDEIFEPFFTTKRADKGSGMGLSTVHGIVHEYGGHILVESTLNQGSSFTVLLPSHVNVQPKVAERVSVEPVGMAQGEGRKVLVVDDEPAVANLLDEVFSQNGFLVRRFNDPEQALAALIRDPEAVDLVVTDQTMPRMTGLELAKAIVELKASLPVIICSGYSETLTQEKAEAIGVYRVFSKPLDLRALLGAAISATERGERDTN